MADVTLPVKRVTGDRLEDRLTEAVYERVLPARYLLRDDEGNVVETPEELFRRVAENVAEAEAHHGNDPAHWADRFEELMTGLRFLPNSPTLMNADTELQQLAACFVISPEDSLSSIFTTIERAATIFRSGGGVGYSFSALRPRGDVVRTTGGVASGPVSFMHVYDEMCEQVKQGGKRRGAQMGVLRVDHPDVGRFCVAKREREALTNFNVSVACTDEFYDAVRNDEEYALVDPRTGEQHEVTEHTARFYSPAYEDADPDVVPENFWRDHADAVPDVEQYRDDLRFDVGDGMTLPARFVWQLLVDGTWRTGDPGIFRVDEANRDHSFDVDAHPDHRIEATNPCGEQPLEDYEACNLGHVNLSLLAAEDRTTWREFDPPVEPDEDLGRAVEAFLDQALDRERLRRVTRDGTRFLDDVVTMSEFPIEDIEETVGRMRKIGLGVMGLAELLVQLGVVYDGEAGREVARQVMAAVDHEATMTSHELAESRGRFEEWPDSKYADPQGHAEWFRQHTGEDPADWAEGFPLRNHGVTSIAPTGTTSMIGNTSGGCEPLYDVVYFKNVAEDVQGEEMLVRFDDYFRRTLAANGLDVETVRDSALGQMRNGVYGGPHDLPIPDDLADLFVTAEQVAPADHVRMQAALQNHVDGAISKTINLPHDADREAVDDAYRTAIEAGCKGVTVYRSGSREEQVLVTGGEGDESDGDDEHCNP